MWHMNQAEEFRQRSWVITEENYGLSPSRFRGQSTKGQNVFPTDTEIKICRCRTVPLPCVTGARTMQTFRTQIAHKIERTFCVLCVLILCTICDIISPKLKDSSTARRRPEERPHSRRPIACMIAYHRIGYGIIKILSERSVEHGKIQRASSFSAQAERADTAAAGRYAEYLEKQR